MARVLPRLRLLPLLLAGLERALVLSLPSAPSREGTDALCPPSKFPCGAGICIPSAWLCDGDRDCSDGRDEIYCGSEPCAPGQERCPWETCFPVRCKGPECTDIWTETSCPPPPCLSEDRFCDGVNDCPNGTDEWLVDCRKHHSKPSSLNCSRQEFFCDPGVCIPRAWVCDGHPDCARGNDEYDCGNESAIPSGNPSASGVITVSDVTQSPGNQNNTLAVSPTIGRGNLTPSERRSAYGLVMAAAALSGVLAAACLLVCCQTWAQVRWRFLPQPNLVEVVKESLLMPERTPSPLL